MDPAEHLRAWLMLAQLANMAKDRICISCEILNGVSSARGGDVSWQKHVVADAPFSSATKDMGK